MLPRFDEQKLATLRVAGTHSVDSNHGAVGRAFLTDKTSCMNIGSSPKCSDVGIGTYSADIDYYCQMKGSVEDVNQEIESLVYDSMMVDHDDEGRLIENRHLYPTPDGHRAPIARFFTSRSSSTSEQARSMSSASSRNGRNNSSSQDSERSSAGAYEFQSPTSRSNLSSSASSQQSRSQTPVSPVYITGMDLIHYDFLLPLIKQATLII